MIETDKLEEFLDLPWSDNLRHQLRVKADRDDVRFLVATKVEGRLTASVYTHKPLMWPHSVVAIWRKFSLRDHDLSKSKTMQAVELVTAEGLSAYAAAKQMGINPSAVTRALQRREDKSICPCCGQVVREGYSIDSSVLKDQAAGPGAS